MIRFIIATCLIGVVAFGALAGTVAAQPKEQALPGWETNTAKRSIELDELMSGGPPKDGIPAIDNPSFVSQDAAAGWLKGQEPVVSVEIGGIARAYPLQILTWHEIVNDELSGVPITVTFCPLCYAALAFDRRIDGETYSFGVSGMLRHSDMIMYDRQTETLWQQLSGEAVIGDLTGRILIPVPAQIISFDQFRSAYPAGAVLSKRTGHIRDYGKNPYAGYDDINERPFLYRGPLDKRVPPMEKVVTVSIDGEDKAYPHRVTRKRRVIDDTVNGKRLLIFHADGAVSALDKSQISDSKMIGSTGVFVNEVDGKPLVFKYKNDLFVDEETGSQWNIAGHAISGPHKGKQLEAVAHGNFFAFAWFAFKPDTGLYAGE
ncbi:MAG: DUF3179 domain-containing protein [Bacteroidota bacterium]